jgi:hypothetical protein
MPIDRPYRRICRPFGSGSYLENQVSIPRYLRDTRYANSAQHYVRAFLMILKDMQALFDFIEPADKNLSCFSFRTHELLLRACVEVEANCKAILGENGYQKKGRMNIKDDYSRLNASHHLASYDVKLPLWNGAKALRSPFRAWATGQPLPWYQAYNATKHDRHTEFEDATFDHMIDAICALHVLLSAQFHIYEFVPSFMLSHNPNQDMSLGIGRYFGVKFPDDWSLDERYQFSWDRLLHDASPFQSFDFTKVSPAQTT